MEVLYRYNLFEKAFSEVNINVHGHKIHFKGELHSDSWSLTFVNKLQFPLILRSFVFKSSKNC